MVDTESVDAFESADVTTGVEFVSIVDVTVEFSLVDAAVVLTTLDVFSVVTRVKRRFTVLGTKSTSKSKNKDHFRLRILCVCSCIIEFIK